MSKILENALSKLRCKCCGVWPGSYPVVVNAAAWAITGGAHISSGYRCPKHNAETEGSSKVSQHMRALALDIHWPSNLREWAHKFFVKQFKPHKVIEYKWGYHYDWRNFDDYRNG